MATDNEILSILIDASTGEKMDYAKAVKGIKTLIDQEVGKVLVEANKIEPKNSTNEKNL